MLLPLTAISLLACISTFAQAAAAADNTPASYEGRIAELQSSPPGPPLSAALAEAYDGLGHALQAQRRHEEAVAAFDIALQVFRQNQGLYELAQLPVLQARIDSSEALAAWRDVDAGRQLAHQITMKNSAAGTERRYQSLRELGLWKLRAAEQDLLPEALTGAREAAALYRHEIERPDANAFYRERPLFLANLYLDLAALEFLQARQKMALPLTDYVVGERRTVTQVHCQTIVTGDGRTREVCRSLQVPNMDYFMALSDRKYSETTVHLDAMEAAVLEAWKVLLDEVETPNRVEALALLADVHRLTDAYNGFVAENARRTGTRIAGPTGSIIRR